MRVSGAHPGDTGRRRRRARSSRCCAGTRNGRPTGRTSICATTTAPRSRSRYGELLSGANAVAAGLRARRRGRGRTGGADAADRSRRSSRRSSACCSPAPCRFRCIRRFAPTDLEEYARRQRAILRNAGARVLVTFRRSGTDCARSFAARCPHSTTITTVESPRADGAVRLRLPNGASRRSCAHPVHVGQHRRSEGRAPVARQLLANIRAIGEAHRRSAGRRRRELAAALSRHGADRGVARRALLRRSDRRSCRHWRSCRGRRAGCGRSTRIAARCRRRPTSPSICACARSPTTRSRAST